jgi:hypothetical protein
MNFVLFPIHDAVVLSVIVNDKLCQYDLVDLSDIVLSLSDVLTAALTHEPPTDGDDVFNVHVLTMDESEQPQLTTYRGRDFPSVLFPVIQMYGYAPGLHFNNLIHQLCATEGDVDISACRVPDDLVSVSLRRKDDLVLWTGSHYEKTLYDTLMDAEEHNHDFDPMLSMAAATLTVLEPMHESNNMTHILISVEDGDVTITSIQLHPNMDKAVQATKVDKLVRLANKMNGSLLNKMDAIRQMTTL